MSPVVSTLKKLLINSFFPHIRSSYAQSGEDIIICDLFSRLGISNPSYLDIGANDPVSLSNTYRLYKRGSKGVCMEPNPVMFKKIVAERKRDMCINAGVAFDDNREADFYMFTQKAHGLNTFSKADADFWEHTGSESLGKFKVEKVVKTPLIAVNDIMSKYFSPHPNLVSIDVEGLDLQIAKMINFDLYKPEVFCIETLQHIGVKQEVKNKQLIDFFVSKDYFVYADTYINTIFCRRDAYKNLA